MKPTIVTTDESLISVPENKRKCRFPKEEHNSFNGIFNRYSQTTCVFECRLRQLYDTFGCIKWDFPRFEDDLTICGQEHLRNDNISYWNAFQATSEDKCDCPADCDVLSYDFVISKKPLDVKTDTIP